MTNVINLINKDEKICTIDGDDYAIVYPDNVIECHVHIRGLFFEMKRSREELTGYIRTIGKENERLRHICKMKSVAFWLMTAAIVVSAFRNIYISFTG